MNKTTNRLKNLLYSNLTIAIIILSLRLLGVEVELYGVSNVIFIMWWMSTVTFVWGIDELCKRIESLKKD